MADDGKSGKGELVYEVPFAGAKLGLNRSASYAAAKRGEIPTVKFGRLLKVPKAAFHAKFGYPDAAGQPQSSAA